MPTTSRHTGADGFFAKLRAGVAALAHRIRSPDGRKALNDRGLLVFSHTGEVIRAERLLRATGFDVEVKGPPPQLRTGCDMVVVFALMRQAAVLETLQRIGLVPQQVVSAQDVLLEPVSLFQVKHFGGRWIMVRAANMKITLDKTDNRIVNISGGGCPDVPWLAHKLCGLRLDQAPEPLSLGSTLCCYSLQKAFEELRRQSACGA
ncbi:MULTISPECIES: DUF3343 domain-containing protein [unclassified Desulfovibrio]|uniref:DUF3343 domain-containing protein n=1 Tax=unclassified Desulfovibrio TaxID=2593640 RepID=UPI000F5EC425|nr:MULTISPECIES: DUF3343 domain-containing protein [unclassified Desulfovibrio]RRD69862.1 DUF3343 domain-containing protein [Desulfovibrio sp. OH1209_COT-279]RRD86453.1 DUF3343 domain-containing protein [Desulfovibrio sp. OH1186_COT-070]